MSAGRVVFDGVPAQLTEHIARELYDLEADEVMGSAHMPTPVRVPEYGVAAVA
jgi:phosphonate transport system ATP-binding protein